ncbi:MAG: transcriptional regulator [Deltaproteobacteria bacterium RIFOXYD12_FULL_55_16]|nr:MAG: transcriptional regulator [Deltaproteobacteria bacterium RIFOXYD12_FULL_55_16]
MIDYATNIDLLDIEVLEKAAECLKTLAHPHRLRMIQILLLESSTVGDLATACQIPSNVASEHLRLLKDRGFLRSERQGRNVYYQIAEPGLASIMQCVTMRYGSKQ